MLTKVAFVIALCVVAVCLAASDAGATSNFGFKKVTDNCCVLRGSRVGLATPDAAYSLPSGVIGVQRVDAEHTTALIQIGYGRTSGINLDDCGGRSSLTAFWEYNTLSSTAYHCAWLDGVTINTTTTHTYKVLRRNSTSTGNETTWGAWIGSTRKLSVNMHFDKATVILAGGELNNCNGCGTAPNGLTHGCYACNGAQVWQRTSSEGGGSWTTIGSATNVNTDGAWVIDPLPGAFRIDHWVYP